VRGCGQVLGMDVDASIVDAVNARRCTSSEPGLAEGLAKTVDLSATTDMAAAVADAELIFVLVPTPNSGGRDYYNHRCGGRSQQRLRAIALGLLAEIMTACPFCGSILANVLFKLNTLRLQNKHVVISATVQSSVFCCCFSPQDLLKILRLLQECAG
jgi:4-hydroxy-3-methylbut-2-en-1-yl diphosphate synthase IspG/GcpE